MRGRKEETRDSAKKNKKELITTGSMIKDSEKLSSGSRVIDKLLDGGYESGIITTIYGPSASGKTTLALIALLSGTRFGKVFFIDTEGGFSVERLKQLSPHYKAILDKTLFSRPKNFEEQSRIINEIPSIIKSSKQEFSLIIIDTITMLYRASRESNNIKDLNRELSNQLNILSNTAHDFNIPVLITNQVYSDFENKDLVKLVGGDVIKYSSKCLIELEVLKSNLRRAILIKHRSLPMRDVVFEIKEKGVFEFKQRRGFGIF